MKDIIKNEKLIISKNITSPNSIEYVIKKENANSHNGITKLSDVFNALPHGLVHKDETGMGATTLELNTKRNSIIVEPIKITASSKARKHSVSPAEKVLYVGSETKIHPSKLHQLAIKKYLNDKSVTNKKIIVVADSLPRVMKEIDPADYKDYFLLLDEVDSFQMDSTYRNSMEVCIDFYKAFPVENKCMLTATPLDFSDPVLEKEFKTHIKFDIQSSRDISVLKVNTNDLRGVVVDKIAELINDNPENKIMIAYNSVRNCKDIAHHLLINKYIEKNDIAILCSVNSKDSVGDFYKELDSESLPAKVNFVTSAYFSGFDLVEKYHLISVSANKNSVHTLSDKRLKQIAGRARNGLLSETIIHDLASKSDDIMIKTRDELLDTAQKELDAIKCMNTHFSKLPFLKEVQDDIIEQVMKALDNKNRKFIRHTNKNNLPEISYLNIDAYLEKINTRNELYTSFDTLTDKLKSEGHNVHSVMKSSLTEIESDDNDKLSIESQVNEIIEMLKQNPVDIKSIKVDIGKELSRRQTQLANMYFNYKDYIEFDEVLFEKISEAASKRDSRELNSLLYSMNISVLPIGNNYKSRLNHYFSIGKVIKKEDLVKLINTVFTECGISNSSIETEVKAVRFIKNHFETKSALNRKAVKIVGNNPNKLKILKTKPELENSLAFQLYFPEKSL